MGAMHTWGRLSGTGGSRPENTAGIGGKTPDGLGRMDNYLWTTNFRSLHAKAVALYGEGERSAEHLFDADETAILKQIGLRPIFLFDHAEDLHGRGEPDYETTLLIASARRDFFLNVQDGGWTEEKFDLQSLPSREDEFDGIAWFPRVAQKAQAFLVGNLPDDIMFNCGGDRKFFSEHEIHPADFLRACWAEGGKVAGLRRFLA